MIELIPIIMFLVICVVLMLGFPVALSLAGTALLFAFFGIQFGIFEELMLRALPNRLYGMMTNDNLSAVPLNSRKKVTWPKRSRRWKPA